MVRPERAFGRIVRAAALLLVTAGLALGASGRAQSAALPSDDDLWRDASARARLFDRIAERLEEVYWDPTKIDWIVWRDRYRDEVADATGRPAYDAAMRRAFEGLEDGHSRWIGRPTSRPAPGDGPAGPSVELGVEALPLEGRGLLILRVHPGSAADAAGLLRGDVVVRAGDAALDEQGLGWTMQSRIAAALRTGRADLTVRRAGEGALQVAVEPRALPDGARERPSWSLDEATGVARIDVPSFAAGTAEAVHRAVREAADAGAIGLLLDLRGNPGGSVLELGLVTALVADGTLLESWRAGGPDWRLEVTTTDGTARARLVRASGPLAGSELAGARLETSSSWTGPLAVLVDERSASAAEAAAALLAGAGDAVTVGRATPGNVESVRRVAFPGGTEAWVAVGELRFPGGAPIAPVPVDLVAELDPLDLARGYDAAIASAARVLRDLPVTPGRWF